MASISFYLFSVLFKENCDKMSIFFSVSYTVFKRTVI